VLAFFLIVLLTNKSKVLSHSLAVGAAFFSWLGSMIVFVRALGVEHLGEHPFESSVNWLPIGDTWFKIGVLVDPLTAVVLFFVAWTVLMIFLYSVGYHNFGQPVGDHDHKGSASRSDRRRTWIQTHGAIGGADVFTLFRVHRVVRVWHVCARPF